MNKKTLWLKLGIGCLIVCITIFPISFFVNFFNHCIAITMLFTSPIFLILFVICVFTYTIMNNQDDM